jgi:hypothetical protein
MFPPDREISCEIKDKFLRLHSGGMYPGLHIQTPGFTQTPPC